MRKFIAIALFLGLAACGRPYNLNAAESGTAELGAREYAERSHMTFTGCSGQDSDKDGYVTCGMTDPQTKAHIDIVCSYQANAKGCKRKT